LLDKHPAEAVAFLKAYDQPNQELLLCLLPLAKRLTEGSLNQASRPEMTAIVDHLQSLAEPLRPRADFLMDKICFCEGAKRFGVYMPLPEDHALQAATGDGPGELVQVYVELRNFTNKQNRQFSVMQLACSVEIISNETGKPVWGHDYQDGKKLLPSLTPRNN